MDSAVWVEPGYGPHESAPGERQWQTPLLAELSPGIRVSESQCRLNLAREGS